MAHREVANAEPNQAAIDDYIRRTARGSSAAEQVAQLAALHDAGKLDADEFAAAKAKALAD